MKKILSLVLVLSMVLGSFGFAFAAPADVEGTDFEDAVTRLAALEILSGYADGTFKPEKTITRAEFAKIMVNVLGVGEAAKYAQGPTKFADVPENHWATGYINVATDTKIINGYGNGNFGPQDQVTYAQAVTMIVRALGFEPKAQAMGGYPGGYLAVAAEEGITEDITVIDTLATTRGDVALMVDAALDVPMMFQKTWGQFPEYANDDEDRTVLKTKLDVEEAEGVVTAIPKTDSKLDDNEIKIDGKTYEVVLSDVNYDKLLGLEVSVWADDSDIFFVEVDTDEEDIYFDSVVGDDTNEDEVYLYVEDDEFDWADEAKVFVNFAPADLDEVNDGYYGYFVLNEDEEVTYANLFDFGAVDAGLVTEVDEEDIAIDGTGNKDLDLEDYEDGIYAYTKSFDKADVEDIDVDSVVYAWEDDDELYIVIVNEKVDGELETAQDDEVEVADTDYAVVGTTTYSLDKDDNTEKLTDADQIEDLAGEEVEVVLDVNGDARHLRGDVKATSDLIFGLIMATDDSGFNERVKVFTQDGEEVVYDVEDSDDFSALEGLNVNDLIAFELNKDGEIAEGKVLEVTGNLDEDLLEDYAVSDVSTGTVDADDDGYITDDTHRGYIEEDTIIFNLDGTDPELVAWADIEDLTDLDAVQLIGESKGSDLVVVILQDVNDAASSAEYAVVTKTPWLTSDGWKVEVDVYDLGTKVYVLDGKETVSNKDLEDKLAEGQLIEFKLDADKEISEATVKATKVEVTDVDGKYIEVSSDWIKFDADAVIYLLDDGDIDEKLDYDEIEAGYEVRYIEDDDKIVALTVVTTEPSEEEETTTTTGLVTLINSTKTGFAVDGKDSYKVDDETVLTDKDGKVVAIGKTDIFATGEGKGNFMEGDKVLVTANETVTGGLATEIKRLATKAELADEAEQAVVDAELAKVADAYEVSYSDGNGKTGSALESYVVALVEADVDTAKVSVAVAFASDEYTVTLTSEKVGFDTIEAEKVVEVTVAEASTDASLEELRVNGVVVAGFEASKLNYDVELANGTTGASDVAATEADDNANAVVSNATDVTANDDSANVATVVVTAEDGSTTKTYTITFTVAE